MELTNEQIEAIKAAARPIKYGSVTIHIGEVNPYLEIDALDKTRVAKEVQIGNGNGLVNYVPSTTRKKKKFA